MKEFAKIDMETLNEIMESQSKTISKLKTIKPNMQKLKIMSSRDSSFIAKEGKEN